MTAEIKTMEAISLKRQKTVVYLARGGVIAALYVAMTVLLQPLGFGPIQCRLSEVLTILPVYTHAAIPGLTVGCFLSNLIGLSTGANPAGGWDLILGTAATGIAAWMTYILRNVRWCNLPIVATLPPIVLNALIVGAELYVVYGGFPLITHMALVALGQLVACTVGGLLMAVTMEKSRLAHRL